MDCKSCGKRSICSEICPEIEALLPKKTTGRHKKEYLFDTNILELLATARAFKLKFSREYKPDKDF